MRDSCRVRVEAVQNKITITVTWRNPALSKAVQRSGSNRSHNLKVTGSNVTNQLAFHLSTSLALWAWLCGFEADDDICEAGEAAP
jgi:hypothetical protein